MSLDINKTNGPTPPIPPKDGGDNGPGANYLEQLLSKLKNGEVFSPTEFAQLISELPQIVSDLTGTATNPDQTTSQADMDVISDADYVKSMSLASTLPSKMDKPEIRPDPKTVDKTLGLKTTEEAGKEADGAKPNADVNVNTVEGSGPGSGPGTPTTAAIWMADNYATEETISMLALMFYEAMAQLKEGQNTSQSFVNTMDEAVVQGDDIVAAAQAELTGQLTSASMSFTSAASSAVEATSIAAPIARRVATYQINTEMNALKNNPLYTKPEYDKTQAQITATESDIKAARGIVDGTTKDPIVESLETKLKDLSTEITTLKSQTATLEQAKDQATTAHADAEKELDRVSHLDRVSYMGRQTLNRVPNPGFNQGDVDTAVLSEKNTSTALQTATKAYADNQSDIASKEAEVIALQSKITTAQQESLAVNQQKLTDLNKQLATQQTHLKEISPGFADTVAVVQNSGSKTKAEIELEAKEKLYNKLQTPEEFEKLVAERMDLHTKIVTAWAQGLTSLTQGVSQSMSGLATLWQSTYQRAQTLAKAAQENTQQAMGTSSGARDKFSQSISSQADWLMSFQQMRTQSFWK